MNVLSEIMAKKQERVTAAKEVVPLDEMRRLACEARSSAKPHALLDAVRRDGVNIIAEFKRRSPSKGMIRGDADVTGIARSYAAGGAVAMSVLTEEDYFAGSLDDLRTVKATVDLPVLRKDFMFEEYQIYEAAAAGADAILLIVAAINDETVSRLRRLAEEELSIDALVEVHTAGEMKRAIACGATIIGVNNRDLRTFEVSLETSIALATQAPRESVLISESGLNSSNDLQRLRDAGYRGFLIGETLMRAPKPDEALRQLLS